jgi:hypothetical protein
MAVNAGTDRTATRASASAPARTVATRAMVASLCANSALARMFASKGPEKAKWQGESSLFPYL